MYVSHSPGSLPGSTRLRIPRPLPQRCTMTDILIPVFPSVPPFLTSWIPGQTPMSTWTALSTGILSYLAVVFGLQEFMKDRPAFKLRTPFRIHNAFLSLSSLVLLALMIEEVTKLWYHTGAYGAFCASASWTRVKTQFESEMTSCLTQTVSEARVLLYDQLLLQVHRVLGHGVLGAQETTALQVVSSHQRHWRDADP